MYIIEKVRRKIYVGRAYFFLFYLSLVTYNSILLSFW